MTVAMDFVWKRTDRSWWEYNKADGTYVVCTAYRSTQGAKLKRVKKGGYENQEEAEKDLLRFRYCVETEKGWKQIWVPIQVRRDLYWLDNDPFSASYLAFVRDNAKNDKKRAALLADGSSHEQIPLSATRKKQRTAVNAGLSRGDKISTSKFVHPETAGVGVEYGWGKLKWSIVNATGCTTNY